MREGVRNPRDASPRRAVASREVPERDLAWFDGIVRAKRPVRLPVVLSRQEVAALQRQLRGVEWTMATLLYGAGLRLLECCRLRVKNVGFDRREITVRDGKGGKDRVTQLPDRGAAPLAAHLERVRLLHEADLRTGAGSVEPPAGLERKYARAPWDWGWQWVGRNRRGQGAIGESPPGSACEYMAAARGVSEHVWQSTLSSAPIEMRSAEVT